LFNETEITKQIVIIVTAFSFGFAFHIVSFFYFRKRGMIADIDATVKEERTLPYIISVILYIIGFAILTYFEADIISRAFWFCYITNTIFITIINNRWKISAHTMGAAGPIAALTFITGFYGLLFLPLLFAIGLSRIKLKCHTYPQVIAGAFLGFVSTYIQMWIFILNS
jgi:membrane-associated phospholipid phosphatase